MDIPTRKATRIPGFDYSSENYYFVTICTHEKKCIFGAAGKLNALGRIAERDLRELDIHYHGAHIDKMVVMPNHIHAIIVIGCQNKDMTYPSLNTIVGQYKSGVTRKIREAVPKMKVWQRSYHDHVIRNRADYEKIWNYIDGNPRKWMDDCYYLE